MENLRLIPGMSMTAAGIGRTNCQERKNAISSLFVGAWRPLGCGDLFILFLLSHNLCISSHTHTPTHIYTHTVCALLFHFSISPKLSLLDFVLPSLFLSLFSFPSLSIALSLSNKHALFLTLTFKMCTNIY